MRRSNLFGAILVLALILFGGLQALSGSARASLPSPAAAKPAAAPPAAAPAADQPQPPPLHAVAQVSASLDDATGRPPVDDRNAKPPANLGRPAGDAPAPPPSPTP